MLPYQRGMAGFVEGRRGALLLDRDSEKLKAGID
jgi:hypothetical protein